jgi:hypothetical protein
VLHIPSLEPRLPYLPLPGIKRRRAEDIRRAGDPVGRAIEHVCSRIDVVHLIAHGRELETETGRVGSAGVCSLRFMK